MFVRYVWDWMCWMLGVVDPELARNLYLSAAYPNEWDMSTSGWTSDTRDGRRLPSRYGSCGFVVSLRSKSSVPGEVGMMRLAVVSRVSRDWCSASG